MKSQRNRIEVGDQVGRLRVLGESARGKGGQRMLLVECQCGSKVAMYEFNLRRPSMKEKSCGCAKVVHGSHLHPLYGIWSGMIKRCTNPSATNFANYGGRGITVCSRWMEFSLFADDVGDRPPGASLERIDNAKGYSPDNCRWATAKEQALNTRRNHVVEYQGKRQPLSAWCEELGLDYRRVEPRISRLGWSPEKAFAK